MFDSEIAKQYGVNCAILLNHIAFWIEKNRANSVNFYDEDYWTYNSARAFSELFPYLTQRQISTALQKLKDEKLIKTGNYNKSTYDRTLWYGLTEKGKSILHLCEMDYTQKSNGLPGNVEPIPDINTDDKPDIKPDSKPIKEKKPRKARKEPAAKDEGKKGKESPLPLEMLSQNVREVFAEYVKMRTKLKKPLTDYAQRLAVKKLIDLAGQDEQKQIAVLEQSITHSWQGLFPLKDDKQQKRQPFADRTAPPIANVRREDYAGDQVPW